MKMKGMMVCGVSVGALARCENGQLSLGTNAGILLMLERCIAKM